MRLLIATLVALFAAVSIQAATWDTMPKEERAAYNAAQDRVAKGETVYITTSNVTTRADAVCIPGGVPGLADDATYRCYRDANGDLKAQRIDVAPAPAPGYNPWPLAPTCPNGQCGRR